MGKSASLFGMRKAWAESNLDNAFTLLLMSVEIQPPDSHHLRAAIGWLELGNAAEARAEWMKLSTAIRQHPDALELFWTILAREENWDEAAGVAAELLERAPECAGGWLHLAYSLRRATGGSVEQAWHALLPAYEKFPTEPVIPYNLACYACQMQRLDDARDWFHRALNIGDPNELTRMALQDEDLAPLWDEIRKTVHRGV